MQLTIRTYKQNCVDHRSVTSVLWHGFIFLSPSNYKVVFHWNFCLCFHGIPPVLVIKYGARKDEPLSCKSVCQNLTFGTSVLHRINNMTVDLGVCMDIQSIEMYFIVYKYIYYKYIYI